MDIATRVLPKGASNAQQILEFQMEFVFHALTPSTTANHVEMEISVMPAMSMLQIFSTQDALIVNMVGPQKVVLKSANVLIVEISKSL
jgi:hypothetical protein